MSSLTYRHVSRSATLGAVTSPEYTTSPDRLVALLSAMGPGHFTRVGNCVGYLEVGARGLVFGYQGDTGDDAAFERLLDTMAARLSLPAA